MGKAPISGIVPETEFLERIQSSDNPTKGFFTAKSHARLIVRFRTEKITPINPRGKEMQPTSVRHVDRPKYDRIHRTDYAPLFTPLSHERSSKKKRKTVANWFTALARGTFSKRLLSRIFGQIPTNALRPAAPARRGRTTPQRTRGRSRPAGVRLLIHHSRH